MAKQSGLHQIRGKVGEHSYYRQSGVASGLIRSINQGLSSRVKTGDEYANTRLNNAEFGAACNVAGELGKMVTPKYRPMILPFSQSKMAKSVLDLARAHENFWGRRTVTADDTPELANILTGMSKLRASDFMSISLTRASAVAAEVSISLSAAQVSQFVDLGVDGFDFKGTLFLLRSGQYSEDSGKIIKSSLRTQSTQQVDEDLDPTSSFSTDFSLTVGVAPVVPNTVNHRLVTVVVLPYRYHNNTKYTLQEYCMFATFELPAED